jgi:FtsZ-binding cell division protein ZapB
MENPQNQKNLKPKPVISPISTNYFYFPSGSVSSFLDSIPSIDLKSSPENQIFDQSCHIITYESICPCTIISKETQTDKPFDSKKQENLIQTISDLKLKIEDYKKQNQDLRREIQLSQIHKDKDLLVQIKDENKKLKATINFHHNMIEKMAALVADINGDSESPNRSKIDVHMYNFIISKLEIIRSRMKRFKTKIGQMEADKESMTELLNFYASAAKLIENSKIPGLEFLQDSISLSRKTSALMENSTNSLRNTPFEEIELKKKTLSYGNELFSNEFSYPNTVNNLKGISKLAKTGNVNRKSKCNGSSSVSPLLVKPKKTQKTTLSKENIRNSTTKVVKVNVEEARKRRARCKS